MLGRQRTDLFGSFMKIYYCGVYEHHNKTTTTTTTKSLLFSSKSENESVF